VYSPVNSELCKIVRLIIEDKITAEIRNPMQRIKIVLALCLMGLVTSVWGAEPIIPSPPQLAASAYILVDADSGKVIVEHNADQRLPPASLTKIMTSYIAASEVARGSISLSEMVNVSVKAWRMGGSKMFIREGTQVSVEDLLRGIVIQSGNDASIAMAEHIAGSEDAFADVMNQQASRLGMNDTNFMNATGWPDENHYTTARDLTKLAKSHIKDHPTHYAMYKEKHFTYNDIRQPNRNSLLWRDSSVDGMKTGHTEAAGYCLVASAERQGMRLISVVMGTNSEDARARESQKLLTYGFRYFETHRLYAAAESLKSVRVWGGLASELRLGLPEEVVITIPRGSKANLAATMDLPIEIHAPIAANQDIGKLTVMLADKVIYEGPLQSLRKIDEAGFFSRLWDSIMLFFLKIMGNDPLVP